MNKDAIIESVLNEHYASDWLEKEVEHTTPTGQKRRVKVKSLPPEEREKYKPKSVGKKLKDAIGGWVEKNRDFFRKDFKGGSEARRNLSNFIQRKTKGIATAIKGQFEEWKGAASAVKKIIKREKLTKDDKANIAKAAWFFGSTAGGMALTGGLAAPMAKLLPSIGMALFRKTALGAATKSIFFADAVDKMTDDQALEFFINQMSKSVANADLSEDEWVDAVKETKGL